MSNILHRPAHGAIGQTPDAHSGNSDPHLFWDLDGRYLIDPATTASAALADLDTILGGTEQVLLLMLEAADAGQQSLLNLVLQQVQMARNLGEAASRGLT
jgi:hypothetical protein